MNGSVSFNIIQVCLWTRQQYRHGKAKFCTHGKRTERTNTGPSALPCSPLPRLGIQEWVYASLCGARS